MPNRFYALKELCLDTEMNRRVCLQSVIKSEFFPWLPDFQGVQILCSKFQTSKISTKRDKFLFFGLKPFQKCKNHQKILMFRYRYFVSKFQGKLLSKMSIFSSKLKLHFIICSFSKFLKIKMIFFIKSWVYIKNVILWCISCYCSSKKEKTGGEQKSYNCSF